MVLFVDDDEEVTAVVIKTLDRLGYAATAINDPLCALTTFSDSPERFSVVILDEIMPGMRGTELARQLIRVKDDIPIVLLTAYGSMIPVEEARASGIRETLGKPVSREELQSVLEKLLGNRKREES